MKKSDNCETCENRECFLYKNSTPEWRLKLDGNRTCVQYKKNQKVIREGDSVEGMYFIQSGSVKVYKNSNYRSQIIRLSKSGDILGHRGFGGNNRYPISATTLEDSKICFVHQELLFKLMQNNGLFSLKIFKFYANELKRAETRLFNMAIMTVRERVAEALLMIHNLSKSRSIHDLDFSRKDIAEIAGTYPEQISRKLHEFKEEGLITLEGKQIVILQPEKLLEMIEQYNTNDY